MLSRRGAWSIIASRNLSRLAERLGVLDDLGAQITRYRKERAAWRGSGPLPYRSKTPSNLEWPGAVPWEADVFRFQG